MVLLHTSINAKHVLILQKISSAGLRLGGQVRLRIKDMNKDAGTQFTRCSKGKKDRYTIHLPSISTKIQYI